MSCTSPPASATPPRPPRQAPSLPRLSAMSADRALRTAATASTESSHLPRSRAAARHPVRREASAQPAARAATRHTEGRAMAKVKMTPSEALVETMVAEGVKNVFGIVGSAYMDALDLF